MFAHVREIAKSDYYFRHVSRSVLPSVRMKQLGYQWTILITIFEFFRNSTNKI
jgi:hypothetical protein